MQNPPAGRGQRSQIRKRGKGTRPPGSSLGREGPGSARLAAQVTQLAPLQKVAPVACSASLSHQSQLSVTPLPTRTLRPPCSGTEGWAGWEAGGGNFLFSSLCWRCAKLLQNTHTHTPQGALPTVDPFPPVTTTIMVQTVFNSLLRCKVRPTSSTRGESASSASLGQPGDLVTLANAAGAGHVTWGNCLCTRSLLTSEPCEPAGHWGVTTAL